MLTRFFICPWVPYFLTSSFINFETLTCTSKKTKNLYTILQHAITLLRNQNWPKSITSFPKWKKNKMISEFESIENGMVSNPLMFLCVHQLYKLIWKLNNPRGPFKQLLANIVTNNPKLISININNSTFLKYGYL
jgi:hypothetical protein